MDIRTLAQYDDKHMAILCGWATGEGAEAFADWLAAHAVADLPEEATRAIVAFETNTAGDDDPITIIAMAEASYGGGSEAQYWYQALDGTVYGRNVGSEHTVYAVLAPDLATVPPITDYQYGAPEDAEEEE